MTINRAFQSGSIKQFIFIIGNLLAIIEKLSFDSIWGCVTRPALELRWNELTVNCIGVVYCDIDRMHDLNSLYGHNGTDERIKTAINNVRHNDVITARWLNGDEVIYILKSGDCYLFSQRMQKEFNLLGINATFSYTTKILSTAFDTISPLDEIVQVSKNHNVRGVILEYAF